MTKAELISFEEEMARLFNDGHIKAPLHLAGGNEDQLIAIFRDIRLQDWVCGSWRSHYHCLLKGVPPVEVKDAILEGRSIGLCFPRQRVIASGIVGGILPIALGLAWAAKRQGKDECVWCFLGDMTAESGIAHECIKYAARHGLPVNWVTEDNGLSVCTKTEEVWGLGPYWTEEKTYRYVLDKPHVGTGKFVKF